MHLETYCYFCSPLRCLISSPQSNHAGHPVAVRHVAGRGRAVFATRDIAAGETVMACAPVVGHPGLPHVGKVSTRLVSSRLVSSRLVSSRLVSSRLVSSRLVNSRLPAPWTLFSPSRLNGYSTTVLPRECCGSQRKGGAPCTACRPPRAVSPFHCCFVSHALRVTVFSCMPAMQGHSQLPIPPLPPTVSPTLHSQPPPLISQVCYLCLGQLSLPPST